MQPLRGRRLPCTNAADRERGAVIPLVALVLPVLVLMAAFAVDLGQQRDLRRTMQARSDVIALDLIREVNNRRACELVGAPDIAAELAASAQRNGIDPSQLTVVWGETVNGQFVAHHQPNMVPPCSLPVPTSVEVLATGSIDYSFQSGTGEANRDAVASASAAACFSIGSFALAVQSGDSIVLNAIINQALGLSILSYRGLADFQLELLDLAAELGLLTVDELLSSDASAADLLSAAATLIARNDPNAAELTILDAALIDSQLDLGDVTIGDLIEVMSGGEQAALESSINLLDLLAATAFIADGGQGLTIPVLNIGIPGLDVNGQLNLTQAPRQACGTVGSTAETSQLELSAGSGVRTVALGNFTRSALNNLVPGLNLGDTLCGLLGWIPLLCPSQAVAVDLSVTLDLELAQATGTSTRIACAEGGDELDVAVETGLVSVALEINLRLRSGTTTLLNETLRLANAQPPATGAVSFVIPPDQFGQYKGSSPGSGDLSLSGLSIQGGGNLGNVITLLNTTLGLANWIATITQTLDAQLVAPLTDVLGVRVSSADVAAHSITCDGVRLTG